MQIVAEAEEEWGAAKGRDRAAEEVADEWEARRRAVPSVLVYAQIAVIANRMKEACPAHRFSARNARQP